MMWPPRQIGTCFRRCEQGGNPARHVAMWFDVPKYFARKFLWINIVTVQGENISYACRNHRRKKNVLTIIDITLEVILSLLNRNLQCIQAMPI